VGGERGPRVRPRRPVGTPTVQAGGCGRAHRDSARQPAALGLQEEWPDEHGDIVGATPYSLRRGMISLRIRGREDRQAIAKQCGTSVEMLERSYSFAIEDLEDEGPKSAGEERLRARQLALAGKRRQLRVA
jgi:hypothetical protein